MEVDRNFCRRKLLDTFWYVDWLESQSTYQKVPSSFLRQKFRSRVEDIQFLGSDPTLKHGQWRIHDFEIRGRNEQTFGCRRQPHVLQARPARGVWGHAPPENFGILGAFSCILEHLRVPFAQEFMVIFKTVIIYFPWYTLFWRSGIKVKLPAIREYWTFQHWTLPLCRIGRFKSGTYKVFVQDFIPSIHTEIQQSQKNCPCLVRGVSSHLCGPSVPTLVGHIVQWTWWRISETVCFS